MSGIVTIELGSPQGALRYLLGKTEADQVTSKAQVVGE